MASETGELNLIYYLILINLNSNMGLVAIGSDSLGLDQSAHKAGSSGRVWVRVFLPLACRHYHHATASKCCMVGGQRGRGRGSEVYPGPRPCQPTVPTSLFPLCSTHLLSTYFVPGPENEGWMVFAVAFVKGDCQCL